MRLLLLFVFLGACSVEPPAQEPPQGEPAPERPSDASVESGDIEHPGDGAPATGSQGDGQRTSDDIPLVATDAVEVSDVADSPEEMTQSEVTEDPYKDLTSHVLLTSGSTVLIDRSFAGYEENVFGAEVYGQMLKVWGSQDQTGVEILVRLDQVDLPGSATPGPPGGDTWVIVLLDGQDAYVTQLMKGQVVVDSCPDTPGMMVSGSLEQLMLFSTTGVGYQTLNIEAEFEVVLGAVNGLVPCAE